MQDVFQQLILLLGDELKLFAEFRSILDQEKEPIIQFNITALEALIQRKRVLQNQMAQMEHRRRQLVVQLARAFGLEPATATLKVLAEFANERQKMTLLKAREIFNQLSVEISEKLAVNGRRVDRSLWLIQNLRRLITNELSDPATYENLAPAARGKVVAMANGGGK